jgi:predicted acetyltransferase
VTEETRILTEDEIDELVPVFADAYPGLGISSEKDRERLKDHILEMHAHDPTASFHGLFRDGELLGIMCLYDFEMNFLQNRIAVAGLGQVAVALTHKREHIAREMMHYFLRSCREHNQPFAALYPFRPDFYRSMGFGYGTKMNQYRVRPSALPSGPSKAHR